MTFTITGKIKAFVPLPVLNLLKTGLGIGYSGDYTTWEEAKKASTGYEDEIILEKVKESLLKVKNGEAAYERDSVLFDNIEYSWPVLAGLLWIASQNNNALNLIDFGGSLGSTYYQNRHFLGHLHELRWNVVEQKAFVESGKESFEDDHLRFFTSMDECMEGQRQRPDTILLSSVLQYLEHPYELLDTVARRGFMNVIIDRTPFIHKGEDRITVQKVPSRIYKASYPARFFSLERFYDFMMPHYQLIAEFDALDRANIPSVFKGFIFRKGAR